MEYIGSTCVPVKFESIPLKNDIDFHFILSFAIDAIPSGKYQNGIFSPYWNQQYHLDGIDIDYENFPKQNSTFAYFIEELITLLKNQSVITVATVDTKYHTPIAYVK
ncbi:hypothetical protein MKW92_038608 [Papaver armeniacum]|nr:hypothetical protein MKW92_038608 [Papaver armeniacum]